MTHTIKMILYYKSVLQQNNFKFSDPKVYIRKGGTRAPQEKPAKSTSEFVGKISIFGFFACYLNLKIII